MSSGVPGCAHCGNAVTTVQALPEQSLHDRWAYCARMLYLHGLMTEGESGKVKERIVNRIAKATAKDGP